MHILNGNRAIEINNDGFYFQNPHFNYTGKGKPGRSELRRR
jgi:hypothetical protein